MNSIIDKLTYKKEKEILALKRDIISLNFGTMDKKFLIIQEQDEDMELLVDFVKDLILTISYEAFNGELYTLINIVFKDNTTLELSVENMHPELYNKLMEN
jgi:hypothetical protein